MAEHYCSIGDLDYGNVEDGFILCTADHCGRMYRLEPGKGWIANPPVREKPQSRIRKYRRG